MADAIAGSARWLQYQRERFLLATTLPLTASLVAAGMSFGAFDAARFAALTLIVTGLFFQLRVADEHKDFELDCAYRPERAVPRGLVTLRQLRMAAACCAALQAGLALWLGRDALGWLAAIWIYVALMWVEFGVGAWLRRQPLLYLVSHMLVMPMIAALPIAAAGSLRDDVVPFLVLAFASGVVLEVGRKIRAQERTGVETYSALYGVRRATLLWAAALAAMTLALVPLVAAPIAAIYAVLAVVAALCSKPGSRIEAISGVAVLLALLLVAIR